MGSRWLARAVAAGAAAGILAFAAPAMANSTININPGNVNNGAGTTAAGFDSHECSETFGGGPYADKDVWVFNLPGNHDVVGDFVSVTATFDTGSGTVTKTIKADGGDIVFNGTSKAYIALDAGWKLTGASAEITGTADFFVLTHTCPASGTPSPSASPSSSPSASPSESHGTSTSPSASPSTPGLPVTGTAVAGIVTTGVLLVGLGVGLVIMQRRRALTDAAE